MSTNLFNPSDRGCYPSRWPLYRGKQLFQVIDEHSKEGKEELLSVSHITGITPRSQKKVTMFQSESLVGYKLCQVGDIVANTMWTWQGAIGVSNYEGVVSPAYNVYRLKDAIYNPRFLDILLRERRLIDIYHSLSTGIRPSRLRLYPDVFLTIRFPVPSRKEQDNIVRYLDWKISGINRLISNHKKEIVLLEELRQELINKTVASLIVKNDCAMSRLKSITRCNQKTLDESTSPDYLFRYVDIGSVDPQNGIAHYEKITFDKAPSRARRIVKRNDIIISTVRTYLRAITMIDDDADVVVSTGFAIITPLGIDSKYLEYCFKSDWFCDEVMRKSIGIAYPAINASVLMNISIPVPDHDTQFAVAKHLNKECTRIGNSIDNKRKQIEELIALKNQLISDVVTGKIDVRDIEVPDFEYVVDEADISTDEDRDVEETNEREE